LNGNINNTLDSTNQTFFNEQLDNDFQIIHGFGSGLLGLWDFRLRVVSGLCFGGFPEVIPYIQFPHTNGDPSFRNIEFELLEGEDVDANTYKINPKD